MPRSRPSRRRKGRGRLRTTLANSSGYSTAGGPWITPENAMKAVRSPGMTMGQWGTHFERTDLV